MNVWSDHMGGFYIRVEGKPDTHAKDIFELLEIIGEAEEVNFIRGMEPNKTKGKNK